jgi:hypothetical protein
VVNHISRSEDNVVAMMQSFEAKKQAGIVLKEAQFLTRLAQRCLRFCNDLANVSLENKNAGKTFEAHLTEFYASALSHAHTLYQAVIAPNTACGLRNPRDVQSENFDQFAAAIEQVYSFLLDGRLFIRLPQLPAKINHGMSGRGGDKSRPYLLFFNRSLDESLNRLEPNIPHYMEQNITYLTVFGPDVKSCPDCENIDTKSITDVICLHTMCADSPSKTSFFMCGFQDENLVPGTYVCVSEGRFSVPEISTIIAAFHAPKNL